MANILELIQSPKSNKYVNILIFGEEGSGKTTWASTASEVGPVLFIDVERSTKTLSKLPESDDIKVFPAPDYGAIEQLQQMFKRGHADLAHFQTVVIDTVSQLQRKQLEHLLNLRAGEGRKNLYLPMEHDYKESAERIRRLLITFMDMPVNLIVLAHVIDYLDEMTKIQDKRPAVTPAVVSTLNANVDLIGYLEGGIDEKTGGYSNTLRTARSKRIKAKSRIDGLPPLMSDSSFMDIWKANERMYSNGPSD